MKKSLLALATLGLFAGAASAQSSVTLFGIVDAAYGHVSANGKSVTGISNSGYNSSRLGFRGVEDIGGGLKAGFWIEGALSNDVGQGVSQTAGMNFQRRSTVSLMGNFGEIRLGRDYTPTFWNLTIYDVFVTNGIGSNNTAGMVGTAGNGTNAVRSDNSVIYRTPGMGGFEGWVQYAFGEKGAAASGTKENDYFGFRLGYAAGPVSTHFAYGKTKGATSTADVKYTNIGFSYDIGGIKPVLLWAQEKTGGGLKVTGLELGLSAAVGAGEIRAAVSKYDTANSSNDWNKMAVGYVHNLSKRTALYGTYARVSNKGTQNKSVSNNGLTAGSAAAGGNSTGYEFGVRHSF